MYSNRCAMYHLPLSDLDSTWLNITPEKIQINPPPQPAGNHPLPTYNQTQSLNRLKQLIVWYLKCFGKKDITKNKTDPSSRMESKRDLYKSLNATERLRKSSWKFGNPLARMWIWRWKKWGKLPVSVLHKKHGNLDHVFLTYETS